MDQLLDFTGQVALVTGGSRGLGKAMALALAERGADLIITSRKAEACEEVAAQIEAMGRQAMAYGCHVGHWDEIDGLVDAAYARFGKIDILINNAGMQHRAPLEKFDAEIFDQMIAVNLKAAFYTAKALSRHMIARQAGKVINIASVMSQLARPGIAPYTATKGAIANLTKGMAADWARYGLNCNAIAPGYFKTELNAALVADEAFTDWLVTRTPAGRWGDVSDLVGTAVFLASRASSFVHGQTIYVDGGLTATV